MNQKGKEQNVQKPGSDDSHPARVLSEIAAALRWTVGSWRLPAASEARWEQNQHSTRAPRDKR